MRLLKIAPDGSYSIKGNGINKNGAAVTPDAEVYLFEIFREISNPDKQNDQRFVDIQYLNQNLRRPCNYSMLDLEEFHLFSLTLNNLYDTDGEISENEFLIFC
jgi:hypothetical protein